MNLVRDRRGDVAANGVYSYELRAGDFHRVREMMLMK